MWILSVEHAHFQLSMHVSVDHVYSCIWPYAHLHLSMCKLALDHVHACTWACARFQLITCTISLEPAFRQTWACTHVHAWAFAHLQLRMCTLLGDHVHTSSWACIHLTNMVFVVPSFAHFYFPPQNSVALYRVKSPKSGLLSCKSGKLKISMLKIQGTYFRHYCAKED